MITMFILASCTILTETQKKSMGESVEEMAKKSDKYRRPIKGESSPNTAPLNYFVVKEYRATYRSMLFLIFKKKEAEIRWKKIEEQLSNISNLDPTKKEKKK